MTVLRGETLRRWSGQQGRALLLGIRIFIKETPQSSSPLPPREDTVRSLRPEATFHLSTQSPISSSQNGKQSISAVDKPPCPRYVVTAAQTDPDTNKLLNKMQSILYLDKEIFIITEYIKCA